jgi:hypothetical protein
MEGVEAAEIYAVLRRRTADAAATQCFSRIIKPLLSGTVNPVLTSMSSPGEELQ